MKIAIYSRKSKFTGKGDSIGNQIDRCKDYINFIFMDNMYLLVRDGRWLDGQAPLGFNHVRESFIDGHGKTRYYSSLVINPTYAMCNEDIVEFLEERFYCN